MDAKELRAEPALTERSNDGGAKFTVQYDRSKCHEVGASAFKGDATGTRPCAVIGPDRVVPPARDGPKKPSAEPWLAPDSGYRRLSDYPYKMSDHKDPTRNISPRQTFQENMQRIIMPPGYNATKLHEDPAFASKNNKLNAPLEVKYCDVPYNINQVSSDQKHIRNVDHSASNVNPLLMRGVPHGWASGSMHVRPLRTYGAPEVLQYPDYGNCTGPRPVLTRTHTSTHDDQLYPDAYYHESNIRFKPYPNLKERYPQTRYEYLGNYPNPYHPSNPCAHKYELPKTIPPHSYTGYPQVPKYPERIPDPLMDGYQRTCSQQGAYSVPIRNPVIHSSYRPIPGNNTQNKLHQYPPDGHHKPVPNKLPYDPTSKIYHDYDARSKPLPMTDNYYLNELPRSYHPKNTIVLPSFTPASMHGANVHPCYIKDNMPLKNYEYARYKNMDPSMINHSLTKLPPQFSPSTVAISPADSNASNETAQTHGTSQEDCGYASQSSVTSARSIESLNRIPMDPYGRYDYRYGPMVRTSLSTKPGPSSSQGLKSKKDIRQFISSWSEGDDENAENSTKRDAVKNIPDDTHRYNKQYEAVNNQEQLYVLGLVNVPSEELSKYEHIQKVSKLPENIKGYNSLELLNQFEEAIESSNISNAKPPTPRAVQMPLKSMIHKHELVPRALSPLDVESKISQSVIHKDVGCNFEIRPCSPKMLNVEVATPMQTLINERVIEKVTNPHNIKSPIMLQSVDEKIDSTLVNKTMKCPVPNTASSCKMVNRQHLSDSSSIDNLKTNYSLQDLESNSGICLASLPRLDTDIELNFPEVNQQFINANKTDSVITTSFTKDLPALDIDRPAVTSTEYDMNYQFSPKPETETDFSRLSKYRKLKRCIPDVNDPALAKAQATRVDSVIIKNPDNTKSLEENNKSANPGNHFRNDFQEFAMNLVSQTKHSKANHQHDVDKMFGTSSSPVNTSKYDDVSMNSPSNFTINQSGILLNKQHIVIEDASRNTNGHAQTEDFNIHSKDLSNRNLEKAAFDIPMNLSPQARHSTIGVDEEIRHSRTSNKTGILDDNHQSTTEITHCLKKSSQEESTYSSTVSLDKTDDVFLNSQLKSVINISDQQCLDTSKQPITTPDISDDGSSSILKKDVDVEIDKGVQQISHIEAPTLHIKTTCDDEKSKAVFELNGLSVGKQVNGKVDTEDTFFGDKGKRRSKSTTLNIDKIKDAMDSKKHDRYISKLKRKQIRDEATHRKRSFEKRSGDVVNGDVIKSHEKKQNFTLPKYDIEMSTSLSTHTEIQIIHHEVTAKETNETDNILIDEYHDHGDGIDHVENATDTFSSRTKVVHNEICTNENNLQDFTDIITSDVTVSRAHVNDKCIEISEGEVKSTVQSDAPLDIDYDTTQHNNKCEPVIQTGPSSDDIVSNKIPDNRSVSKIQIDQIEPVEPLRTIESINSHAQELDIPVSLDQFKTKIKEDINFVNKELDTRVQFIMKDRLIEETKSNVGIHLEKNDVDTPKIPGQVEKPSKESNAATSVRLEKNENELQNKDLHLETIPFNNEERYLDIPFTNWEDNLTTVSSDCKIQKDASQEVSDKQSYAKKISHPLVKKELFSPRFQNLLICNEIFGAYSGPDEPQIQTHKQSSLDNKFCDHVTRDQTTCATTETGVTVVKCFNKRSNRENIMDLDLPLRIQSNIIIDDASTTEACNKEIGNTTSKNINVSMDSDSDSVVGNDLNKNDATEGDKKHNSPPEMQGYDETETITPADIFQKPLGDLADSPLCGEVFNEHHRDLEKHNDFRESDLPLNDNVENNTCATNIIVIDETASVSPEHSHEFSEIITPVVNDYESNKNLQSFIQNINARPRFSLKRSLSDSALNAYDDDIDGCSEKRCFMFPKKRRKFTDIGKIDESHLLNIIQSSRRNSVSTLSNENFSFCILIDDNCIVAEENYDQENFEQVEDDLLNHSLKDTVGDDEKTAPPLYHLVDEDEKVSEDTYVAKYDEEKAWVEDVGCEETIETDDIAENIVIGDPVSPKDSDLSDYESDDEDMDILNNEAVNHTSKVKHIYGDNMCTNDAQLVDALYRTPQMDVNKKLMDRESHINEKSNKYYDSDSLEMLLAEPVDNIRRVAAESNIDSTDLPTAQGSTTHSLNAEIKSSPCLGLVCPAAGNLNNLLEDVAKPKEEQDEVTKNLAVHIDCDKTQDETIHSCESSLDNVFSYIHKGDTNSSSPEVSSTTPEEKNSSILLKISNCKGSRISEVKHVPSDKQEENSSKLGIQECLKLNYSNDSPSNRPLRTKAAQKYIPPLRESIPDLKVKLALPQQSLLKFQKNKVTKEEPKLSTLNMFSSNNNHIKLKKEIPRKIKPKFEDVLKNIDEAQFQMHKEKNKKAKKYIPKVVIKKSENGSHYASTSTKESFNPDLTGRKWQPWVFIEKNKFIDDMALRFKTRAVFSHRRKSFVLAEKFCKYKSISSAKFVITQPKINDLSTGNLKYTIKLKHSY